jgi:hypothetical protein
MGKCMGKYRRVVHYDESMSREVYDKFGNLISGGFVDTELYYGKRKLYLSKKIQVLYKPHFNVYTINSK